MKAFLNKHLHNLYKYLYKHVGKYLWVERLPPPVPTSITLAKRPAVSFS